MRSFALFALVATGFTAIASAIPLSARQSAVARREVNGPIIASIRAPEDRRSDNSLFDIIVELEASLEAPLAQLLHSNAQNATSEALQTVVGEIDSILTTAVDSIKALDVNTPVDVLLGVDIDTLSKKIGDILTDIFAALSAVIKVSLNLSAILSLLTGLGSTINILLKVVLGLLSGTVQEVLQSVINTVFLAGYQAVILLLNITSILGLVGL